MSFHEIQFPPAISLGSSGGPERKTEVVTLSNGYEERNAVWQHSRRRYDAGVGMASLDDLADVVAFFEARMGRLYAFRWKDWADHKSCGPSEVVSSSDQILGTSDGATTRFPLRKAYTSGGQTYWRTISKPVSETVIVAVNGLQLEEFEDFEVDLASGEVEIMAPMVLGAVVTAGFEFDVPARFDLDVIETNVASFSAGQIPNIPVIEVRV